MTALPGNDRTHITARAGAFADAPTRADRARQVFVIVAAVAEVAASVAFNQSFDGIDDPGGRVYFVPAGYAFAIWGLIFAGALAYAVYQARPGQATRALHRRIGWPYGLTMFGAAVWLAASAQPNQVAATATTSAIIVAMLAAATITLVRLRTLNTTLSRWDRVLAQAPATIYFAWLTLATIANATAFFNAAGWTGGQAAPLYAVAMLVVGTALASVIVLGSPSRVDMAAYSGVAVWALVAILVNNLDLSSTVATTAGAGALVVALVTVARWTRLRPA